MAVDKRFLRLQIIEQLDHCHAVAFSAGHHQARHGETTQASMQAQAEADAKLVQLIEDYAALGVRGCGASGHGNLVICVPHGVWDCPRCAASVTEVGLQKPSPAHTDAAINSSTKKI